MRKKSFFPLLPRHVQSQPAPLREARVQHMQLEGFARKLDIAVAAGIVDRETSEVVDQPTLADVAKTHSVAPAGNTGARIRVAEEPKGDTGVQKTAA